MSTKQKDILVTEDMVLGVYSKGYKEVTVKVSNGYMWSLKGKKEDGSDNWVEDKAKPAVLLQIDGKKAERIPVLEWKSFLSILNSFSPNPKS